MKGAAESLWKLAYNLCLHEQMEQERDTQSSIFRPASGGDYPDQRGSGMP